MGDRRVDGVPGGSWSGAVGGGPGAVLVAGAGGREVTVDCGWARRGGGAGGRARGRRAVVGARGKVSRRGSGGGCETRGGRGGRWCRGGRGGRLRGRGLYLREIQAGHTGRDEQDAEDDQPEEVACGRATGEEPADEADDEGQRDGDQGVPPEHVGVEEGCEHATAPGGGSVLRVEPLDERLQLRDFFGGELLALHELEDQGRGGPVVELLDEGLEARGGDAFAADAGLVDVGLLGLVAGDGALLLEAAEHGEDGGVGDALAPGVEVLEDAADGGRAPVPEDLQDVEFGGAEVGVGAGSGHGRRIPGNGAAGRPTTGVGEDYYMCRRRVKRISILSESGPGWVRQNCRVDGGLARADWWARRPPTRPRGPCRGPRGWW